MECENVALLIGLGELENGRDLAARGTRVLFGREQQPHGAVVEHVLRRLRKGGDGLADACDLVALHREHDVIGALVAVDGLELHAEQVLQQHRHLRQRRAGAVGAHQQARARTGPPASSTPLSAVAKQPRWVISGLPIQLNFSGSKSTFFFFVKA